MPSGGGDNGTNRRAWVAGAGLTTLSAVSCQARVVPGMPLADGTFDPYTDSMIAQDVGAALLSFGLAYGFVNPAAQGQSRDSLRCDDVLETCGHYIYD